MKFTTKSGSLTKQPSHCLVIGVYQGGRTQAILSDDGKQLDKTSQGYLTALLKQGDIQGKIGQTLLLQQLPHVTSKRVLLVGFGKKSEITRQDYQKAITNAIQAILTFNLSEATFCLTDIPVKQLDLHWKIRMAIEAVAHTTYCFSELKSQANPKMALKNVFLRATTKREQQHITRAILEGTSLATGLKLSKDLSMLPGNICTPSYLANRAKQLAKHYSKVTCNVLTEADMKKLKMGALLSVSRGSAQGAKLITLHYKGGKTGDKPVVLVGKGITFDTGGINLKPSGSINGMKFDMCGAASVMGTLNSIAALKLPLNVIGVIAAAENMPSSTATRPDDVVTSMSGQTIEIDNTDAEGRLVLCDALTYIAKFKPRVVIDIATLTGAIVVALGTHASGVFSNHEPLAHALYQAGQTSGDRTWTLPIWDDYQSTLDSPVADMCNSGRSRAAGSITAACFLSRFTKNYQWAHIDVAGTAMPHDNTGMATGRPVPLLLQYLLDLCG